MAHEPFDPRSIEEYLRQVSLKELVFRAGVVLIVLIVLIGLMTCYFTVEPEGKAVVKRFGRIVTIRDPGLHFKLPFWIDKAVFVPTERVLKQEFGFRTVQAGQRTTYSKNEATKQESVMLTGDLNVIDGEWVVQYRVDNPVKYLHRVREPQDTIRDVAEAVMRRIVGNRLGSDVLTVGRVGVAAEARVQMQKILDDYDIGIHVGTVELQDVTPPDPVKPAFNKVNESRQHRESLINEAERQRNKVIPRAEGEASQIVAEAEAYKAMRVNAAKGEASRFTAILQEYRQSKDVTRRRLYLEMIDKVIPNIGKLYVVDPSQTPPLPLLDLAAAAATQSRNKQAKPRSRP